MTWVGWLGIGILIWFPAAFALAAALVGRRGGIKDRCQVVSGAGNAVIGLALGRILVPWDAVPTALWGVAAGITAWGALTAALEWGGLPAVEGGRRRWRITSAGCGAVVSVGLVVAVL